MVKQKTEKPEQKTPKTVFAVIDLQSSVTDQNNVAMYAAHLAKNLHLDLVLYPNNGSGFGEHHERFLEITRKIIDTRISEKKINVWNFFTSLHDIAAQEHAGFILMGLERTEAKSLGNAILSTVQKTPIPIMLLPHDIQFKSYEKITIAIDEHRKVQKMNMVNELARAFGSTINIFQENIENPNKIPAIRTGLKHIQSFLEKRGIGYHVIKARKTTNFRKHLCKYASEHSDLLIIEVEPGKIDDVIKQNIETLLSIDQNAQPVLITKTQSVGKPGRFN